MSGVTVSGLSKSFGPSAVLDSLDLTVPDGSLTAVLGPSGSGKTTLLRVLAGFERADSGSISFDGDLVDGGGGRNFVPPRIRRIGYVSQEGNLFPHLTVTKNVAFGLKRGPDRDWRVEELIELVGLTGLRQRFPHQLSGGQQQRVSLARALAVRPSLVLLDEPFTSLDGGLRAQLRAEVKRILGEAGTTAVLVTHDQDEALSCADVVAVIRDGRIAQQGTPRDIYARPDDEGIARAAGVANVISGTAEGRSVATVLGLLPLIAGRPAFARPTAVSVLVRPEHIQLALVDSGTASEPVRGAPGHVTEMQFLGHDVAVTVAVDAVPEVEPLIARATGDRAWAVGDAVALAVNEPVHVWAP
jgi:iron(III) transport system ATP-binding protein